MAILFLLTHLGIAGAEQEATPRPQRMTPAEDARLAARAAKNPGLENFTAGQAEAFVYGGILAVAAIVGVVIACPLGWTHSTKGKGFVPAEVEGKTFQVSAVIFGFPLYTLGYLIGLPFVAEPAPAPPPGNKELEKYFLGSTVEVLGHPKLTAASDAADRAGLKEGDLILDIDQVEIDGENLPSVVARYAWGDSMDVGILREGCRLRMTIATKN